MTSAPHAVASTGCAPSDVTASTIVIAPRADARAHMSLTGFSTPVDVSAWTIVTRSAPPASAWSSRAGSHARPQSLSTRVTVGPYPCSIGASRCAKYPFTTDVARVPGRVRFAMAASMPDVPVPETANENASGPALKATPRRARMSSRIAIISGSRWLSTGALIASMTRGATGLGPGPRRSRSVTCDVDTDGIEQCPDLLDGVAGERTERRPRQAAVHPGQVEGNLQTGNPEARGDGSRERREPLLTLERFREPSRARVLEEFQAEVGRDAGDGEDCALRAGAQRAVGAWSRSRKHGERLGHRRRELGELRRIGARFLEAGDVAVCSKTSDRVGRHVDAGES